MSDETHPIVLRMEGMSPEDLAGYEGHRLRKGGDLGHVDPSRSHLNRRLIGEADWARRAAAEIEEMRLGNFADELEGLKRRRRTGELARRLAEGPKDPWRATRHGPMREVILTANRKWFDADLTGFFGEDGPSREQQFEALALSWLKEHFGEDAIHARADLDEQAYHIHAVILPRATTRDGRRMLQPSKHAMIKDYEAAQDSVGEWFAPLGLARGETRKEAIRDAARTNAEIRKAQAAAQPGEVGPEEVDVPLAREHVSPRAWREAQEAQLAERREALEREKVAAEARERQLRQREAVVGARQADLDGRDAVATAREANIEPREARLDRREATVLAREEEADAVLGIAAEVADGKISASQLIADGAPENEPPGKPNRLSLAHRLFSRALARLRDQARADAQAELARACADIAAADETIVTLAARLPEAQRAEIAAARRPLTARLMALKATLKGLKGRDDLDEGDR